MPVEFLVTVFVTLIVVIDPIGTTPIFVALTQGMDRRARRGVAIRACATAIAVLAAFTVAGEALLQSIGISLAAFRIAGGILLFLTALEMLFGRRNKRRQDQAPDEPGEDPSVFPIAIPLLAGPGSIASVILLAGQSGDPLTMAGVLAVVLFIFLICFLFFLSAEAIERALGETGILVTTRLLGMLLAALSVQFVLDGIVNSGVLAG
ncbi:MarC family protein [Palleronia sediminis]|uniref:UPF0056 membrane protein n=1 Tax=Palleronia sediminis TaxID=2547833 RepID=A0A4R6AB00_9RHOB|nr:MarC family protein [Palleronia sediminis]TDL79498.1 MarC family protein [Palleronia sediminis]